MERSVQISQTEARRRAGRRLAARRPFVVRKQMDRRSARRRIAARTSTELTAPQRAFDPLHRPKGLLALALAILASLVVHALVGRVGYVLRSAEQAAHDEVKIEVRQRPPLPTPEAKPPEPDPEPQKPKAPPPKKVKAEPPPPVEAPKPMRVVGLSMESTTEGGSGPSFAVGNTRAGETADKAVSPKDVSAVPAGPAVVATGPARSNRAASRIPSAGVKYELPKRKRPHQPPYPTTLKSQAIEGDVTVMVSLDETGKVISVKILKETPYPEFTEAARATALAEEFEPATRDGVPMPYTLSFTYRFRLEDE